MKNYYKPTESHKKKIVKKEKITTPVSQKENNPGKYGISTIKENEKKTITVKRKNKECNFELALKNNVFNKVLNSNRSESTNYSNLASYSTIISNYNNRNSNDFAFGTSSAKEKGKFLNYNYNNLNNFNDSLVRSNSSIINSSTNSNTQRLFNKKTFKEEKTDNIKEIFDSKLAKKNSQQRRLYEMNKEEKGKLNNFSKLRNSSVKVNCNRVSNNNTNNTTRENTLNSEFKLPNQRMGNDPKNCKIKTKFNFNDNPILNSHRQTSDYSVSTNINEFQSFNSKRKSQRVPERVISNYKKCYESPGIKEIFNLNSSVIKETPSKFSQDLEGIKITRNSSMINFINNTSNKETTGRKERTLNNSKSVQNICFSMENPSTSSRLNYDKISNVSLNTLGGGKEINTSYKFTKPKQG